MTLRLAHPLSMAMVLTLAFLSVLSGGQLPVWAWALLIVPWLSAWCRFRQLLISDVAGFSVGIVALAYGVLMIWRHGAEQLAPVAAVTLMGVACARLLSTKTLDHDLQSLLLSLLLVFSGSLLHQRLSYGVILVLYAVVITWAQVIRYFVSFVQQHNDTKWVRAMLDRTDWLTPTFLTGYVWISLLILLSSGVLFVLFPRVGMGRLAIYSQPSTLLPHRVSLFESPRVLGADQRVIARIRGIAYDSFAKGLYLRSGVFDQLHMGNAQSSASLQNVKSQLLALAPVPDKAHYSIFLEPMEEQVLLTLGPFTQARLLGSQMNDADVVPRALNVGPNGELLAADSINTVIRYTVEGGVVHAEDRDREFLKLTNISTNVAWPKEFAEHFLALPASLDARIVPFAKSIVGDANSWVARAMALRRYLLTHYTYTELMSNAVQKDPLAAFLFDDPRGHCEYFATAFAVLLRAVGIPSRLVGGFQGGIWDPDGQVVLITGKHAHAWVEWYMPERGWVTDDATPSLEKVTLRGYGAWLERLRRLWDDHVVDFGLQQQMGLLTRLLTDLHTPATHLSAWAQSPDKFSHLAKSWFGKDSSLPARQIWLPGLIFLVMVAALLVGWWYKRYHNRQVKLTDALSKALARVLGRPLPVYLTFREAMHQIEKLSLRKDDVVLLWHALSCYERQQFGKTGAWVVPYKLIRDLRRIRRAAVAKS